MFLMFHTVSNSIMMLYHIVVAFYRMCVWFNDTDYVCVFVCKCDTPLCLIYV